MRDEPFHPPYGDTRVRRPTFPLGEAIAWYLSDIAATLRPTTLAGYRSDLGLFLADVEPKTLAGLTPENVEAHVRAIPNRNTRAHRTIALKAFARYLADRKLWHEGDPNLRLSVLRDVKIPRPSPFGMPGYRDEEIRSILRSVQDGPNRRRNLAVVAVLLHGLRSKEVRLLPRRAVILPQFDEIQGELVLEEADGVKGDTGGPARVPMEPFAKCAIVDYLRLERPAFAGKGTEPLFLTDAGTAFTAPGWSSMCQRLRRYSEDVPFKPHRLRATRVQMLHTSGWGDLSIQTVMRWRSPNMLRRYVGRVAITHLKALPTTLDRFAVGH